MNCRKPSVARISSAAVLWLHALLLLNGGGARSLHAVDNHGEADRLAAEAAALLPAGAKAADTLPAPPPAPGEKAIKGEWTAPIAWAPHIPTTAALLPDGRLLTFASNQRTTFPDGLQFTYAAVWDPVTGQFTEINHGGHDMFCGGVAMLPDGRLHVAGGNGINSTTPYTSIFDWRTNQWSRVQTMTEGRWYNTSVALPNGEVLTASGNAGGGGKSNGTLEQWSAISGWRALSGIPWASVTNPDIINAIEPNWHPFLVVAPDGRLAHFGPYEPIRWLDTSGTGSMTTTTAHIPGTHYPKQGSWAMYDAGKIVVMGGYAAISDGTIVNTAFKVDLNNTQTPAITPTQPMVHARSFANAVVLPNGEVMVVGGNTSGAFFSDSGTVFTPEVWSPVTEAWRPVADISVPRNYHSLALLLADGRVWSGGGGLSGDPVTDHQDAQIFTPPQLFNANDTPATRPQITAAPDRIRPGAVFSVNASPDVQFFSMLRLASLTHSVTTDQRFVTLTPVSQSSGSYTLTAPVSVHVLTPGYWMLYAVSSGGVWSVSRVLQVTHDTLPVVTNPGQQRVLQNSPVSLPIIASTGSGALNFSASGLPGGLGIHSGTGVVSGTLTAAPGTYQCTVFVSANGHTSSVTFKWIVLLPNLGSGQITREWWTEIPGRLVADLTSNPRYPASPNGSDLLGSFETPSNWQDSMGQRVRGYLHPPVTGQYRFYIASDDTSSLRLSTDAEPAHAAQIASQPDWTDVRAYNWYPQQASAPITLNAGTACYIEALMKDGNGGDHLSVAWLKPGDSVPTVINGTYLSPFQVAANQPPVVMNPGDQSSLRNASISMPIVASDPEGEGLSFSANGLPAGLTISESSGIINGTASVTGAYEVMVRVTDGAGASATVAFMWNVNAGLTLGRLGSMPRPVNTVITFNANSSNGVNPRFKWNFGDGSPETGFSSNPVVTKTYASPGRYNVTLTATDDSGIMITRNFAQAVHATLTSTKAASSASIAFEDLAGGNDRIWCVNADNNSITGFDVVTLGRVAEISVGISPRALAFAPDGRLWVVNTESATISIINTSTFVVTSTVPLARGSRPWGLVFHAASSCAWLALEGAGRILRLNPTDGGITAMIPLNLPPRHLSVSADGAWLYATRFITPPVSNEGTSTPDLAGRGGEVVVVSTSALMVDRTIVLHPSTAADTETSSRGLPNYIGPAVISPDGLSAWVPSKLDNIQRGMLRDGNPLNHENTVRAIVSRLDLAKQAEHQPSRKDIDNAGMPSAVTLDPWGMYVFVAMEASRDIVVLDAWSSHEVLRFAAGRAPQGIEISPDGMKLFAHNFMDRTITVHDIAGIIQGGSSAPVTVATLACVTSEKLPDQILQGKKLFYDAKDPRLARQGYMSCATCHNDGGHDGRVWDLAGFGEGLRNTITLQGHGSHGLLHWSANFDEVQDFEGQIRQLAGGSGLISAGMPDHPLGAANAGRSSDLDALAAYVASLTGEQNSPFRTSSGELSPAAAAGQQVFRALNCAACHAGANFTNDTTANIGTIKTSSGSRLGTPLTSIDVPTLRGLWATAPYLHDGSASTIEAAISAHQGVALQSSDLANLAAYVRSIDSQPATAPVPFTVSLTTPTANVTAPFKVTATLNASTTNFVLADVAVTNGTASSFNGNGSVYTFVVTPASFGDVSVQVPAGKATDATSLGNLSSNTLTIAHTTADVLPPSVTLTTPSASVSEAFVVTATFTEEVAGLLAEEIAVTNGIVTAVTSTGAVWGFQITPTAAGIVTVTLPANAVQDAFGNRNAISNTLSITHTPPASQFGATGTYYSGTNFENLRFTRVDRQIEFDWPGAPDALMPADDFSIRWTGSIVASVSGTYDIITRSDDGVRFWLNGTQSINNWTNHGEEWDYATIALTAGRPVPFVMEFYENNGGAMARLWWQGPGVPFQAIPAANLRAASNLPPPVAEVPSVFSGGHDPEALLKHAFGVIDAGGAVPSDRGLRIDRGDKENSNAVLLVPTNIKDVIYILEFSTDLMEWTPTNIAPVFTLESKGVWRITWHGVPPFVRVRVIHTGGVTAVGPPAGSGQILALTP